MARPIHEPQQLELRVLDLVEELEAICALLLQVPRSSNDIPPHPVRPWVNVEVGEYL